MKYALLPVAVLALQCLMVSACLAQERPDSGTVARITNFPSRFLSKINAKTSSLNQQLTQQSQKYMQKLQKEEARLQKKLSGVDSNANKTLLSANVSQQYATLQQKIQTAPGATPGKVNGTYLPYVDSLQGTLTFLNKNPQLLASSKVSPADVQNSLQQLQQLQAKMQAADQLQQAMAQRQAQIGTYFTKFTGLPGSVSAVYADYNKQVYYYSAQLQQYKDQLNNPDKLLQTALTILNKMPVFTSFMQRNSMLSGLLGNPGAAMDTTGASKTVTGLQSRAEVTAAIQKQTGGAGGVDAESLVQKNTASAEGQIDNYKQQLQSLVGDITSMGSSVKNLPGSFTPNKEKLKSFFQRIQFGTDISTSHGNFYFPTTTNFGATLGYKMDPKNDLGIGVTWLVSWGTDYGHIDLSSQGITLRSFIDHQLKGSIYLTGGLEYTYEQPFIYPNDLRNLSNWTPSGLIGLTKVISLNSKFLKQTKVQLLWNFLNYFSTPATQPLVFRIGYNF